MGDEGARAAAAAAANSKSRWAVISQGVGSMALQEARDSALELMSKDDEDKDVDSDSIAGGEGCMLERNDTPCKLEARRGQIEESKNKGRSQSNATKLKRRKARCSFKGVAPSSTREALERLSTKRKTNPVAGDRKYHDG